MKRHFTLICALCIISLHVLAQDIPKTQVSSEVQTAFQEQFPNAKDVEWERRGDAYKVEFEIGRRDHDVSIDQSGRVTEHREEIGKGQLPNEVTSKIKQDYNAYKVDDVRKIEKENTVSYEVELDGRNDDKRVMFNGSGEVLEDATD